MLFTVAVPAMAADEEPFDQKYMPVITSQPHDLELYKNGGDSSVPSGLEAYIPSGGGSKLGYELYLNGEFYHDSIYSNMSNRYPDGEYYYIVYNAEHPEYRVQSESFTMKVKQPTIFDYIGGFFFELFLLFAYMGIFSGAGLHVLFYEYPKMMWEKIFGK